MATKKRRSLPKKEPTSRQARKTLPCAYGCGRESEGTLTISFSEHLDFNDRPMLRQDRFNCQLPTCRICVKEAVSISVSIPKSGV
jgi:hypothetical protein